MYSVHFHPSLLLSILTSGQVILFTVSLMKAETLFDLRWQPVGRVGCIGDVITWSLHVKSLAQILVGWRWQLGPIHLVSSTFVHLSGHQYLVFLSESQDILTGLLQDAKVFQRNSDVKLYQHQIAWKAGETQLVCTTARQEGRKLGLMVSHYFNQEGWHHLRHQASPAFSWI